MDEQSTIKEIQRIIYGLSPENLHCDGEISRSAAMVKYRKLTAELKVAEKKLGRRYSMHEIYNFGDETPYYGIGGESGATLV